MGGQASHFTLCHSYLFPCRPRFIEYTLGSLICPIINFSISLNYIVVAANDYFPYFKYSSCVCSSYTWYISIGIFWTCCIIVSNIFKIVKVGISIEYVISNAQNVVSQTSCSVLGAFQTPSSIKDCSLNRGDSTSITMTYRKAIIIFLGHITAALPCFIVANTAGYGSIGDLPSGLSITFENSIMTLTYTGTTFYTADFKFLVY